MKKRAKFLPVQEVVLGSKTNHIVKTRNHSSRIRTARSIRWRGQTPECRRPWMQIPSPVNGMTHACEHITLPQTSFADGNNVWTIALHCVRDFLANFHFRGGVLTFLGVVFRVPALNFNQGLHLISHTVVQKKKVYLCPPTPLPRPQPPSELFLSAVCSQSRLLFGRKIIQTRNCDVCDFLTDGEIQPIVRNSP